MLNAKLKSIVKIIRRKKMGKGLEALESLMKDYYEMCLDTGNNDDEYQRNNLTSEYHIIQKELKVLEIFKKAFGFEIEDYTEDEFGAIKVKYNRIILEDEYIDMAKEVLKNG